MHDMTRLNGKTAVITGGATGMAAPQQSASSHCEFTRINIEPIILPKEIEGVRKADATSLDTAS